jgi:hypothetical protein
MIKFDLSEVSLSCDELNGSKWIMDLATHIIECIYVQFVLSTCVSVKMFDVDQLKNEFSGMEVSG